MNVLRSSEVAKRMASELAADEDVTSRMTGADLDEWVSVDEFTDINLWSDEYGALHATAYPVVAGQTLTDRWVQLF